VTGRVKLVVGPDGALYGIVATSEDIAESNCEAGPEPFGVDTGSSNLSLMRVSPDGGVGFSGLDSSAKSGALAGSAVIPDGQGGVLATWFNYSSNVTMVADIGTPGGGRTIFSSFPTSISSMVLGDNNTAFATNGYTVMAFDATSLQQKWSYTSTGGALSFVVATAGGGVTIDDSQQGVIQLDSSGNASAPVASLQAAMPFQPGLPIFIGQDGTVSGAWNNGVNGVLSSIAGVYTAAAPSVYPESSGEGQNQHASVPTVTSLTVHFTGSKSTGDLLTFHTTPPALSQTCNENPGGPLNCPGALNGTGTWVWNVEIAATVTDDASKWTAQQAVGSFGTGNWKDSQGGLHPFGAFQNRPCFDSGPCDDPLPGFTQQAPRQKAIYWLDAPGHSYDIALPDHSIHPIDSLGQVQNFTSSVCNRANICAGVNWFLRLVVDPGGALNTANSQAGLGHVPF
jgi:hypothetical protein